MSDAAAEPVPEGAAAPPAASIPSTNSAGSKSSTLGGKQAKMKKKTKKKKQGPAPKPHKPCRRTDCATLVKFLGHFNCCSPECQSAHKANQEAKKKKGKKQEILTSAIRLAVSTNFYVLK